MTPVPEFLLLRRVEIALISVTVTAIQKFIIVLYLGASLWNGALYDISDRYLMPNKPTSYWLSFFLNWMPNNDLQGCNSMIHIFSNHRCINSLCLKDDTAIHEAASKLSKFSKWHYLIIVRSFKLLAPVFIQLTVFILIPLLAVILHLSLAKKILDYFGCTGKWLLPSRIIQHFRTKIGRKRTTIKYFLGLVLGFLVSSGTVCLFTSNSNLLEECQTPMCLYCYPRLMHTIFKDNVSTDSSYKSIQAIFTCTKYFNTAIFSSILYVSTVVFFSTLIFFVIDAVLYVWKTGKSVSFYLTRVPLTEKAADTLHQYINSLKNVLPSPKRSESNCPN